MDSLNKRRELFMASCPVWEPMTLYQRFADTASRYPEYELLLVDGIAYSYAEVLRQVELVSDGLWAQGVRGKSCVAVWMSNRLEFVCLTFALAKLGAVKVPVNRNVNLEEMQYILNQTEAEMLIMEGEEEPSLWEGFSSLHRVVCLDTAVGVWGRRMDWESFLARGLKKPGGTAAGAADGMCDIIYTSGSTGQPKGAILTHDMLLRSAYASCINRGFAPGRRIYVPLPLFHVYGYVEGLLAAVLVGGSLIITRGKFEAEMALEAMEQYHAQDILSVPFIMMKLLQFPGLERYSLKDLNAVYCSASICPRWVWGAIREKLKVSEVMTGYGMTEVSGASLQTDPMDADDILLSRTGKILYGGCAGLKELDGKIIEYRVIDGETGRDQPPGEYGELICRGPVVTKGYYNFPEATESAVDEEGWLHTGDIGYFDGEGYLKFLGRCNDMYKINGENVSPQFLDKVISKCEYVVTAETVGVPDEKLGWVGVAFIDTDRPGKEWQEKIIAYCKEHLAPYQVPKHFIFGSSSEWPHTTTGKVQKFRLRECARKLMEEGYGQN